MDTERSELARILDEIAEQLRKQASDLRQDGSDESDAKARATVREVQEAILRAFREAMRDG